MYKLRVHFSSTLKLMLRKPGRKTVFFLMTSLACVKTSSTTGRPETSMEAPQSRVFIKLDFRPRTQDSRRSAQVSILRAFSLWRHPTFYYKLELYLWSYFLQRLLIVAKTYIGLPFFIIIIYWEMRSYVLFDKKKLYMFKFTWMYDWLSLAFALLIKMQVASKVCKKYKIYILEVVARQLFRFCISNNDS